MAGHGQSDLDAAGDSVAEFGADAAASPACQTGGRPALVAIAGVALADMGVSDPSTALLIPVGRVIHDLLPREGNACPA